MRAFQETQRFSQWWLILIILSSFGIIGYSLFSEYQNLNLSSQSDFLLFIFSVLLAFVALVLIFIFRLKTEINEQGVYYGFWPIQLNLRHVAWNEIKEIYVREYSPISEYGGWGYKFSFGKHGKAYNISGTTGIQIIFKNGKKTLLGTNKKEEAIAVLKTYQHKLNPSKDD